MVEVVKPAPSKECTCDSCRSILRYEYRDVYSEIKHHSNSGWNWDEMVYSIKCPSCGHEPSVPKW